MTIGKQLAQFVICPVAMAATVGLCLWVLLGPLHIDQRADYPVPEQVPVPVSTPEQVLPPAPAPSSTPEQVLPSPAPASTPDRKQGAFGIAGVPGDSSPSVRQMQDTLVKKGYSVGPAGADGNFNDDTLAALEAFQDDNALPVRPQCDQQCRTALGLSGAE